MKIVKKIKKLGNLFSNRLQKKVLNDAIEYADFSECRLAVEILAEYIVEYCVPISLAEFKEFKKVADEVEADLQLVESLRLLVLLGD